MSDSKAKLLIVDDDPIILTTLSSILSDLGYAVRTVETAYSALSAMCQEAPDILVSDLNMPGTSGFELLRLVSRWFPEVSTVAMSGAFSGREVPSGVAANAFYQKGSSLGALVRIIESLPKAVRLFPRPAISERTHNKVESAPDGPMRDLIEFPCPQCRENFRQVRCEGDYLNPETTCPLCGKPGSFAHAEAEKPESQQSTSPQLKYRASSGRHNLN